MTFLLKLIGYQRTSLADISRRGLAKIRRNMIANFSQGGFRRSIWSTK